MDSVFSLSEEDRAQFLQSLAQAFGCTYICLWCYRTHPSNSFFMSMGGWYNDDANQPSSSSGSQAQRLFNEYRQSIIYDVQNEVVPGLAFKRGLPYMELNELELLTQASIRTQQLFYQEASIKSAAFMGCKSGEIELGMSMTSPINMEMEMRKWFPEDFSQQSEFPEIRQQPDPNRPSSSSSSLRSLSMDSPEYSPVLLSRPSASYIPEPHTEAGIEQALVPKPTSTEIMSHQQAIQAYNLLRSIHFPTSERDDDAMTRAMLAVISSPSSSSSSYQPQQQHPHDYRLSLQQSAFKNYSSSLVPSGIRTRPNSCRNNMLKRAIQFIRNINFTRTQGQMQATRPTSTQLHHMISERKRREKLNESFEALRALLPPGSKKDKASVLSSTKEYLGVLKAQLQELSLKNQELEARLAPSTESREELGGSSDARPNVQVLQSSESTPEEREIELQVSVREDCDMLDLSIRLLDFLKQTRNISLVSVEANSQLLQQTSSSNRISLRLKIQGNGWDEIAFREAVTRVVADVAQ